MRKIILTISISIITIIILLSFIDKTPIEASNNTADIVYSINNIEKNLKSVGELDKRQQDIICATSKGLVEVNEDGDIQAGLAESYEINDDGLEYIFKIRDDVYWSNGDKITAEDIVLFFREIITEENEISALLNVFGVKDYLQSNKTFSEAVAITSDNNNLKIRLNSKDDGFIKELTKPQYRIRKDVLFWEDITLNYKNIPYSGDYYIENINEKEIVLKRSDKASLNLAKTIHLVKDENEDLALAAFEISDRDIVINPPKSQLSRLKSEGRLIQSQSNEALYLAFNPNNSNFSNEVKNEIYRLINEAIKEYQNKNNILVELAECSYFRDGKSDLNKLQARNVMINTKNKVDMPKKIVIVAKESLENKEITTHIINWFKDNTDISIVINLLSEDDMKLIGEKNYYDVALINIYAKLDNSKSFLNTVSSFIPKDVISKIYSENLNDNSGELFLKIEEELFNNYRVLPLLFYNYTIATNKSADSNILDANGNIDFKSVKK